MTSSPSSMANSLAALYEQDYYLWLEATAQLLRTRQLAALDAVNLLEEIEDMGRSEKRVVYSNLKILLMHLLEYRYQPQNRSSSWMATIVEHRQSVEHRQRLKKAFKESPSLQPYCVEIFDECYQDARELVAAETGLAMAEFPSEPPFTSEQILNPEFLPD